MREFLVGFSGRKYTIAAVLYMKSWLMWIISEIIPYLYSCNARI